MAKHKPHKRQYRTITFKVFYDTDEDILDWWEGIENGDRSETLRDLIRDRVTGRHHSNQKSVPEPEVVPLMELARVRDDTTWIREALHDIPAYLEQVIQTVAAMQPVMATAGGVISLQPEPALSTQVRNEREVNMRKKKW
jgi:hypothetical protein